MQLQSFIACLLAFATFAVATPIETEEKRQLNGLLCPLTGTTTCALQCRLVTGADGQCAPNQMCYCADDNGTILQ